MIFLDTNVLIDVLEPQDGVKAAWSRQALTRRAAGERLVSNVVVLAELASGLADADGLATSLQEAAVDVLDLDGAAALRAGKAYREYRRRGGAKSVILADFLIAGHATTLGAALLTRDRRLTSYFPDLSLITPETHPHG